MSLSKGLDFLILCNCIV